jgi:predicted metal-dependent hydrolase
MTAEITERRRHARQPSTNVLRDRHSRTFAIGDEKLTVRVRESARARTARIIVGPRRPLEVIVPTGTADRDVDDFLAAKRRWVERKVAAAREIAARPPRLGLERSGVVWLNGEEVPLERENGSRSMAAMDDGRLVVRGEDEDAPRAVERWYRREARKRIEEVAVSEAARLGLEYHSLGIRDPRTRWGSCSRRGHLSFSWRLVAAPPDVLRYVVVHELCHLREPSHSKAFWRLLEAARPGWQQQARWLREHGQELHDFTLRAALTS